MNSRGTFTASLPAVDPQKVASGAHNSLRTTARASEKVGCLLSYQAALRTMPSLLAMYRWARSATTENSPSNAGAVLWIALRDQCRWVSNPRRWRTSWNVVSICQRKTNQEMIRPGSASRSVHSKAWVSNSSCGSRIRTQRRGTAGKPVLYQMALSDLIFMVRPPPPYQLLTVMGIQAILGSSTTAERFGRREPFRRGLPICPGLRGGAGS